MLAFFVARSQQRCMKDSLEDLWKEMRVRSTLQSREFQTISVKASEMKSPVSSHLEDGVHRGLMMNHSLGCGLAQEY